MLGPRRQLRYEDVVLSTAPAFYAPMDGPMSPTSSPLGPPELVKNVRGRRASTQVAARVNSFLPGQSAPLFSGTTADGVDWASQASWHVGDVMSVMVWFNRTGVSGSSGNVFSMTTANDFRVGFNSDKVNLFKNSSGAIYTIDTPTFPTPYDAGWQCVLFTKNGTSASNICTAYLNGTLNTATTYTNRTIVAGAGDPSICSGTNGSITGSVAHIAVWGRVITAGEAKMLYDAGRNAV